MEPTTPEQPLPTVVLLGTSHIANESIVEVKSAFKKYCPVAVCVELDPVRLQGLLNPTKDSFSFAVMRKIGVRGYLFGKIASMVQKYLGKKTGIKPGHDMLAAVHEGAAHKAKIYLIDQHIEITLRSLSSALTFGVMWTFVVDFFKGLFFRKRMMKELHLHTFDLSRIPSSKLIASLTAYFDKRYPTIAHALLHVRNKHMVKQIVALSAFHRSQTVLVVVGAAHVSGMYALLQKEYKGTIVVLGE